MRGDIGRVADDEVELRIQRRAPIAAHKRDPRAETKRLEVSARNRKRALAAVDAKPERPRTLGEDGGEQRARARAETEHAKRGASIRKSRERRFDHGFGFRPRHQRIGTKTEGPTPELFSPHNACNRFSGEPARKKVFEPAAG